MLGKQKQEKFYVLLVCSYLTKFHGGAIEIINGGIIKLVQSNETKKNAEFRKIGTGL